MYKRQKHLHYKTKLFKDILPIRTKIVIRNQKLEPIQRASSERPNNNQEGDESAGQLTVLVLKVNTVVILFFKALYY